MPTISRSTPASPRSRHFGSRTRLVAFLIAVAAVLAIGAFSVVQATLPSTTAFKLDGYWDGNGSGTDWSNAGGVLTYTDGTGADDDIFWTGGSKDVRPIEDWRWKTGPTPSQKTDLLNVSVRTETIDGDLYAFFSAVRASSVGNAKIGFWILRDAVSAVGDGRFSGTHTIGDVLVDVDWITGSINTSGIRAYQWEGDPRNGPKRLTEHPLTTFGDCKTVNRSTATVCATVNTTSIPSPWGTLAAGRFIEGAVNLTDTFGITSLGCGPTILAETRASGSSVMSSLEDFVGASLSNCSITITKSATDDTSVYFDYTAGGGITPASFQLRSGQSRAMGNVDNSAYTITEAAKAGWAMTSLSCTNSGNAVVGYSGNTVSVDFTNDRTGRVACTYVNRELPTITLVKDVVPNDASAQFALLVDGETKTTTATDESSWGPYYLTAGSSVTVSETDGSGAADLSTYTTNILCSKPGTPNLASATNLTGATRSVTIPTVSYDDAVTCTFTNTRIPQVRITKLLDPSTDTGKFYFTVDSSTFTNGGPGYGHNGSIGFVDLSTGVRTIGETSAGSTVLADYTTGISCAKNGGAATAYPVTATATSRTTQITVSSGDTFDCTITNTRLPKLIVEKLSTGSTGTFHFDVSSGATPVDSFDLTTAPWAGAGYRATKTYTLAVGDGLTVYELRDTPGFTLTDAACFVTTAGNAGTVTTGDIATRSAGFTNITAGTVVTCTFVNSGMFTTRTQGFWSTHPWLVERVWNISSGDWSPSWGTPPPYEKMSDEAKTMCLTTGDGYDFSNGNGRAWDEPLVANNNGTATDEVLGAFWSGIKWQSSSPSDKRSSLDQAKMRLAQQLMAAILNNAFFHSDPLNNPAPYRMSIRQAKDAFCVGSLSQVEAAQSAMGYFNESGDSGSFTPGGSAKPRRAQSSADVRQWDDLPGINPL